MEAVKLSNKEERRQKIYAWVGKTAIAKRHFSKEFKAALDLLYPQCNTSIHTVSILTWYTLIEKGDLRVLLKEHREITRMEAHALNLIYKRLRDEYFKEFGFGEHLDKKNRIIIEVINLYCDMVINDDHRKYSPLKKLMDKLESMAKHDSKKHNSLIELSTIIKKVLQVNFNLNECSIYEFFGYLKLAEKQMKNGRK